MARFGEFWVLFLQTAVIQKIVLINLNVLPTFLGGSDCPITIGAPCQNF